MCLLPCLPCCALCGAGAAYGASSLGNNIDDALSPKVEPAPSAFVTELKLLSGVSGGVCVGGKRMRLLFGRMVVIVWARL